MTVLGRGAGLLVLHTLRCGGYAGLSRLSAATGLSEAEVESELIDLAVEGHVARLGGPGYVRHIIARLRRTVPNNVEMPRRHRPSLPKESRNVANTQMLITSE